MTDQTLQPIETVYRGYRFRSRLEARYAVLFDAAGIRWQYEVQGYVVAGRHYLPDFWLTELKCFAEVRGDAERAKEALPLLQALSTASGHPAILLTGDFLDANHPQAFMPWAMKDDARKHVTWRQCIFCGRIGLSNLPCPGCSDDFEVIERPDSHELRIAHALDQARQARFEHGETGEPDPCPHYISDRIPLGRSVYVAGAAVIEMPSVAVDAHGNDVPYVDIVAAPWREEILGSHDHESGRDIGSTINGGFYYGGPTIVESHGQVFSDPVATACMSEVRDSRVLFAWIDGAETIGTIAEIGAAYAHSKPIFIAFANEALAKQFYFAKQLATVAIVTAKPTVAWKLFGQWQRREAEEAAYAPDDDDDSNED